MKYCLNVNVHLLIKFSVLQCMVLDGAPGLVFHLVPRTVRKRDKDIVSRQNMKIVLASHRMECKPNIHRVPWKNVMVG